MVEKMRKRRIGVVGFGHLGEIPARNMEGGGFSLFSWPVHRPTVFSLEIAKCPYKSKNRGGFINRAQWEERLWTGYRAVHACSCITSRQDGGKFKDLC